MNTRRNTSLALALAATAAAAVASAGAESSDPSAKADASSGPALRSTDQTTAVIEVQADIRASFAIFREQPATPMPASLAQKVASPSKFGRNSDLARAISTPYGNGWVVPGDGYLCLAVPDPVDGYGVTCTKTELAVSQGLWLRLQGDHPSAKALDTLLLPDGTKLAAVPGRSTTQAGRGAVNRVGVASDERPTVVSAN